MARESKDIYAYREDARAAAAYLKGLRRERAKNRNEGTEGKDSLRDLASLLNEMKTEGRSPSERLDRLKAAALVSEAFRCFSTHYKGPVRVVALKTIIAESRRAYRTGACSDVQTSRLLEGFYTAMGSGKKRVNDYLPIVD